MNCEGCMFWSHLIAEAHDDGVYAMCLNPERKQEFVREACAYYENGTPVDVPHGTDEG